jgi:hypothetical protein
LQKTFGIKGGPPSPQLASEITPNVTMLYGAEAQYLEGWQNFGIAVGVVAGGAGTRAAFRIDNPKGSGVCAVIEKFSWNGQPAVGDTPIITYSILSSGDMPNSGGTANTGLDQRGPQSPQLHVTSRNDVNSVLGVTIHQCAVPANTNVEVIITEHMELPLLPNSSYSFYSNTLNQALNGNLWWRERPLEASEVT